MGTQIMPQKVREARNQYICDVIKTNSNSQRHDLCYMYSKEGVRFQVRKVIR